MTSCTNLGSEEPDGSFASDGQRKSEGHTPGPWVAFDRLNSTNLYSKGNHGSVLAVFHSHSGSGEFNITPTTRGANANLAAAAPDLLAALKECLGWHDSADDLHKPIEVRAAYMRARAAIAKADPQ